jgi:hypothetical protein
MAQGRIFMASDVGGHKELIRDGETAAFCRGQRSILLVTTIGEMLDHHEQWPPCARLGDVL